ncbi:MAG: hypothetical protein ACYSP9_02765, partial [Planctomycetota bacterium]
GGHDRASIHAGYEVGRFVVCGFADVTAGVSALDFIRHKPVTLQPVIRVDVPPLGKIDAAELVEPGRIEADFRAHERFGAVGRRAGGRSAKRYVVAKLMTVCLSGGVHLNTLF